MNKENLIVFEMTSQNQIIEYVCEIGKVFESSKYKHAFDKKNFPLKINCNIYWDFLIDLKKTPYTWSGYIKKYDKVLSIQQ